MFWKKKPAEAKPSKPKAIKLPGPKGIPKLVGRHLVTELKQNPDRVRKLKSVVRPKPESKDAFDFRVFDEAQAVAKKLTVKDYNSLNEHPDLILYEGWFDKERVFLYLVESMKVQMEDKKPA